MIFFSLQIVFFFSGRIVKGGGELKRILASSFVRAGVSLDLTCTRIIAESTRDFFLCSSNCHFIGGRIVRGGG